MARSAFLARPLFYLLLCAMLAGFWGGPVRPSYARGRLDGADVLSFARLGVTEKSLRGPFDAAYIDFSLPANWKLGGGAQLQLNLNTFFAGDDSTSGTSAPSNRGGQTFGGTLQVVLNNVTVSTVLLDQQGERTITIPITTTALLSTRSDSRHVLSMLLDTHEPCGSEQYTSVVIRSSSALLLPHRLVAPPTDLARLPLPLVQRSFEPDAATIVTPDTPTAAELQAALTIAAGFGRMSGGMLALDLIPAGRLTDDLKRNAHLIFVGKPVAFPMLKEADLPAPPDAAGFAGAGAAADDGIVQMAVSPWNDARVLLIASGDSDSGVVKAAQAIGSGAIRTGERPDLALIVATRPPVAAASVSVDRTFADLGYDTQKLYGLGGQYAGYSFDIPPGQAVAGDAYLDLVFVHTALLDYDQSDLLISLNDEPIASVRLDDNSTRLGTTRLSIPASALRAGSNQLTIRADLLPRVVCTDPRGSGLWMVIRPESQLHLPVGPAQDSKTPQQSDLGSYPAPFTVRPNLSGLAFVLGANDPTGWNIAARVAADLGRQMQGSDVDLVAAYGDVVPEQIRKERDLLVIGRPDNLALVSELGAALPAPFVPGSNLASEPDATVTYRMTQNASLGYLELLSAPWSAERTVLAVLGSTGQGLEWAGAALTTPKLRGALTGNLAVIQGEQIDSRDTRPKAGAISTSQPAETTPPAEDAKRPNTFLLLAAGVAVLIVLGGAIGLVVWWRRRRLLLPIIVVLASSATAAPAAQTSAATITIAPAAIPITDAEIVNPMRGFYRWYGGEPIPQPHPAYDHYARFGWRQLEPSRGQYDFSAIEQALQEAASAKAKFAFRVMSVNEFTSPVEIPDYLKQEAGGAYCTYNGARVWVPAWDSPQFLARAQALVSALGTRFNGDPRLGYYDMGIYGHWGEWHTDGLCTPPASDTTKRALVDMQVAAFASTRILMNSGGKEVDAFVYALSKSPRIGVRVDSLCNPWFANQFTESPVKLAAMQDRWKTAPIVTEFYTWNPSDIALCDQQVSAWHIAAMANGTISNWGSYSADQQAQILTMGKHSGYRFVLNTLTYPAEVTNNTMLSISSQWSNAGVTPAYAPFAVTLELRPKGQTNVLWSGISGLDLEHLLPTTQPQTVQDQLYLPGWLAPGVYTLSLVVYDRSGYHAPLALAIVGRDADGRYPLGDLTITAGPPGHAVFLPLALR